MPFLGNTCEYSIGTIIGFLGSGIRNQAFGICNFTLRIFEFPNAINANA
jgi:hypothetical protein